MPWLEAPPMINFSVVTKMLINRLLDFVFTQSLLLIEERGSISGSSVNWLN